MEIKRVRESGRPDEHYCPITQEIMKEPTLTADGITYEREAIEKWLKTSKISPTTGLPLNHSNLTKNTALKNLINNWKPKNELHVSIKDLENRPAHEIMKVIESEFKKVKALQQTVTGKDIVAFLGNTGSGKSTLINLLAGIELKIDEDGNYVLVNPADPKAMAIGTANDSKTLYPQAIQIGKYYFLDLPGFNDTEGSERNLINSALIRQVLLDAASVRLVFIAGQDQFTADRGDSINKMFMALQQLFVFDVQDGIIQNSIINDGVVVITKSLCKIETLIKKMNTPNTSLLHEQLKKWNDSKKLWQIWDVSNERNRSLSHQDNLQASQSIIASIDQTARAVKVKGINVSVLCPPETNSSMERVFLSVMEEAFRTSYDPDRFKPSNTQLSKYDYLITSFESRDFWQKFEMSLCDQRKEIGLLKPFCINPYKRACQTFEKDNSEKRSLFLNTLKVQRQERIKDIQSKTENRSKEVVKTLVPKLLFDFGYQKDFYQAVCGNKEIQNLATDPNEQEIVKKYYEEVFINRHMEEQMLSWRDSDKLINNNKALTKRIEELEQQQKLICKHMGINENVLTDGMKFYRMAIAEEEKVYEKFINGVLIYKPDPNSDKGKVVMPIRELTNPLEGTFDLSTCGNTGKYLSFSTGYKKVNKHENVDKMEIWFVPRYLVEKHLLSTAESFSTIIGEWWKYPEATIGIFRTWGRCDVGDWYYYLIEKSPVDISRINLSMNLEHTKAYKSKEIASASFDQANLIFSDRQEVVGQLEKFTLTF